MGTDTVILELIKVGRLEVFTDTGEVFAPKSNTPHKNLGSLTRKGYLRTCITCRGKRHFLLLHRIIWISVNGIPERSSDQINHKNTLKTDNRLQNLELVSNAQNQAHAKTNGLSRGGWRGAKRNGKGQFIGKKAAGRLLDGREWSEFPTQAGESPITSHLTEEQP